jgi:hypothetical protein
MPGGDRTGPMGMGAMSGRSAGYCAGYDAPGYANPGPGRGFGMGFGRGFGWQGRGRGWRNRFWARFDYGPWNVPPRMTPEQEVETLKAQAAQMSETLQRINDRLSELEGE